MICPGCETEFGSTEVADGYDGSLCGACEERLASPDTAWRVNDEIEVDK